MNSMSIHKVPTIYLDLLTVLRNRRPYVVVSEKVASFPSGTPITQRTTLSLPTRILTVAELHLDFWSVSLTFTTCLETTATYGLFFVAFYVSLFARGTNVDTLIRYLSETIVGDCLSPARSESVTCGETVDFHVVKCEGKQSISTSYSGPLLEAPYRTYTWTCRVHR